MGLFNTLRDVGSLEFVSTGPFMTCESYVLGSVCRRHPAHCNNSLDLVSDRNIPSSSTSLHADVEREW